MNRPLSRRLAAALPCLALAVAWASPSQAPPQGDDGFFERRIRPLFVDNCYECHSTNKKQPKGGLRLDVREGWMRGGDSGPAIVPGDVEASLLVKAVRYGDHELQMPPKGKLSDEVIADLERWIAAGAYDPRTEQSHEAPIAGRTIDFAAAREHWAFRPMRDGPPPAVRDAAWVANPIDAFVLARLEAAGLAPAPEADRRTLLRRASFDLIGLPPTPEETAAFLADAEPGAFERVVERLLASPHYGERWGRYWLDVARYADSNGLDENLAFGNAWRYRDWVVRAFNADLPYDQFVTLQLAGDLLPPSADLEADRERRIATGFLSLGPKMLAEQDKEKLVMDVVDEQIDVVSRGVLGLTASCARCHDHKFDPIPTRDYYALAGVFRSTSTMETLDHVSRWREHELASAEELAARDVWREQVKAVETKVATVQTEIEGAFLPGLRRESAAYLLAANEAARDVLFLEAEDFSRGNLHVDHEQWGAPEVGIVHTDQTGTQWVEYDITLPGAGSWRLEVRYAAAEPRPMRMSVDGVERAEPVLGEKTGSWMPDGQRWFVLGALALHAGRNVIRFERDGAVPHLDKLLFVPAALAAWPQPRDGLAPALVRSWAEYLQGTAHRKEPLLALWHAFAARPESGYVELTAELRVERDAGRLVAAPATLGVLDGLPPQSLREVAGRYQTLLSEAEGDESAALRNVLHGPYGPLALPRETLEALYPAETRARLTAARAELEGLEKQAPAPFPSTLAVAEGDLRDVAVHVRGSHLNLGPEPVPRGFLQITEHVVAPPAIGAQQSGRLELARWLTEPEHPLTARVLANRLWQGHFGAGLVDTPSNFGLRGGAPTHPELLDWLARELVRGGWSLKALHRTILLSSTYRMSSQHDAAAAALDPENRLLWRMNRRRLEAELVRDALLFVGGTLDLTLGGSLLATENRGYVTNDQSNDQARYDHDRRSLYLPIIRNALYDVFATFDYNDPSLPIEKRPSTTVPGQALLLMNSPLVLKASDAFARRVLERPADERIDAAYSLAFCRAPSADERASALRFLDEQSSRASPAEPSAPIAAGARSDMPAAVDATITAWQRFCQVLMASNEFLYVD